MTKPAATVDNDRRHLEELNKLEPKDQWATKYLYDRLNIIDSKTSALLRFNGIMLGFVAVLGLRIVESAELQLRPHPGWYLAGCCLVLGTLAYAEWQAFNIFSLRFDRMTDSRDFTQYKETFFAVTCDREERYQWALNASKLGGLLFIILIFALILQSRHFSPLWALLHMT